MFERREGMRLGQDQEQARKAAVAKADAWTLGQAARLEVMPKEILEAVRRGWLPENIAAARTKYALEDDPPQLQGVDHWVDEEIDRKARAKARRATEETAMSAAFRMAAE